MILIYLETSLGVPDKYGLQPLQYIFPASTAALPDCPVIHLPSDCGEIGCLLMKQEFIWSGSPRLCFKTSA